MKILSPVGQIINHMKYLYLLFFFVGFLLLFNGIHTLLSNIVFLKRAIIVPGTIVRYHENDSEHGEKMYAAVVSFSFNGQAKEVFSRISSSSHSQGNIGQIRKVAINPNDTTDARIVSYFWDICVLPAIFIIGGSLFCILGIFFSPNPQKIFLLVSPQMVRHVVWGFSSVLLLVPAIVGAWLLYSRSTFSKTAMIVPGTIVRYKAHTTLDRETRKIMYSEVISYMFENKTWEIESPWASSNNDARRIGKTVKVSVNPQNPQDARLDSKANIILAIALICFSGFWLLLILRSLFS